MGSRAQYHRRRARLFAEQNGICHWAGAEGCTIEMVIYPPVASRKNMPPDMCTIDHLFDRFDPNRRRRPLPNEQRIVAACWACNTRRGREREAEISLATLRRRSQRHPQPVRTAGPQYVKYSTGDDRTTLADLWPRKEA